MPRKRGNSRRARVKRYSAVHLAGTQETDLGRSLTVGQWTHFTYM